LFPDVYCSRGLKSGWEVLFGSGDLKLFGQNDLWGRVDVIFAPLQRIGEKDNTHII